MVPKLRVLIVDDHPIVRQGIRLLLEGEGIEVAGEAADGCSAIDQVERLAPDVVLMDLVMPEMDGVAAIRAILARAPEARIVALSGSDVEERVFAAIREGALGFLPKTAARDDYLQAIHRARRGEPSLPPELTRRLLTLVGPGPPASADGTLAESLTDRETEVLCLLAKGWNNRRIAKQIHIAEVTVRTHVRHLLGKLGLENRVEAALYAVRQGLTSLDDAPEA